MQLAIILTLWVQSTSSCAHRSRERKFIDFFVYFNAYFACVFLGSVQADWMRWELERSFDNSFDNLMI